MFWVLKTVLNIFAYWPYNIERCNSFPINEFKFKVEVHVTYEECDFRKVINSEETD